jgi:diacylglycerol kinase family enzyme
VFKVLQSLDIDGYSAFILVGTDQTFNAGINGMLARADGLKLPVGLIPISPQSDICFSLGNPTVDHALDYICRRETIEIDTIKVMIDTDETEELPQGPERLQKQRYMIQNSTLVMPA